MIRLLTENLTLNHGANSVNWDGRDNLGNFCVTGLYQVTVQVEGKVAAKTVVILNK